ncbi:putative calcium-binding protein [Psilocybe cubensis]|uniref:Calcium-binding protein n=2 Tax=Psilocybe cubensis TaxID=181762 RepID=A0ACB8HGZ4_PSICU|nr:putative calcium-binding protein [Psilocybe cubensis]KAH9486439.1 putative calcium-binding protein [Psilocybe cubensis]
MLKFVYLSLLGIIPASLAHGSHEESGPAHGESIQEYAQRHMSSEHHIDSFDVRSFFQLHDLNRNGFWEKEEIEAIYGVHHVYSQKKSKDDIEHQKKADHIVSVVLQKLDLNGDGLVSPEELEKVGLAGLPNFDGLGAEGHHYDVESEFFLHHEEQFHSTPETQTDESYTHPEDLEHFAQHESIERKEAEREAKFQGVTVEEIVQEQEKAAEQAKVAAQAAAQAAAAAAAAQERAFPASKPVTRVTPPEKQDPEVKYKNAGSEGVRKGEWGTGDQGYKPPTDPSDKLRKNLPYKNTRMQYKFRRNWGDF